MRWTIQQVLSKAGMEFADSKDKPDGIVIIGLWNKDGRYDTRLISNDMLKSDIVALLDLQKHHIMHMIGDGDQQG